MSLAQIEAELEKLTPDELRRLALRSWSAFVEKEGGVAHDCDEDDPASWQHWMTQFRQRMRQKGKVIPRMKFARVCANGLQSNLQGHIVTDLEQIVRNIAVHNPSLRAPRSMLSAFRMAPPSPLWGEGCRRQGEVRVRSINSANSHSSFSAFRSRSALPALNVWHSRHLCLQR
jgi:hypothetical protein